MVQLWWGLLGVAVPAAFVRSAVRDLWRGRRDRGEARKGGDPGPPFICERACTSQRQLSRMGARDTSANTCVTVCSTTQVDACAEACRQSMCAAFPDGGLPDRGPLCAEHCRDECRRIMARGG